MRGKRMTKSQKYKMIDYLENNNELLAGKINPIQLPAIKRKWEELAGILNAVEDGPKKTIQQWKEALGELKTNTKRRARDVRYGAVGTGGGPKTVKDLNEVELRLMQLLNNIVIMGADVHEAGIAVEQPRVDEPVADQPMFEIPEPMNEDTGIDVIQEFIVAPAAATQVRDMPNPPNERPERRRRLRHRPQRIQLRDINRENFLQDYNTTTRALVQSNNNIARALHVLARAIRPMRI